MEKMKSAAWFTLKVAGATLLINLATEVLTLLGLGIVRGVINNPIGTIRALFQK
jgi:hypothetical protein